MRTTLSLTAVFLVSAFTFGASIPASTAAPSDGRGYLITWTERQINHGNWGALNMTCALPKCTWTNPRTMTPLSATVKPAAGGKWTVTVPGHVCLVVAPVGSDGQVAPVSMRCHKP